MRAKRQKPQIRQVAIQKHENLCQSLQKQEWAGSDSWATLPLKDMKVEVQRPWLPPRGSTTGVLGLRLSALPSAAASDDRAYFRSNCLGEGLRVVLTFLWRQKKKKGKCTRKWGLRCLWINITMEGWGAQVFQGMTQHTPLIWSQNSRGPKGCKINK